MCGDGVWFGVVLLKEGWEVDWLIGNEKYADTLKGIMPPPLTRTPDAASYDLIVFDVTGMGKLADAAREKAPVIGDSVFADKLEKDRIFGLQVMEQADVSVPQWEQFDSPEEAKKFVKKSHKRFVFKPCGDADCSLTYVSKSDTDMLRYLDVLFRRSKVDHFILQEFVEGTEVSTEAWFNGSEWTALNHTLEEKKFMAGGLGPNTGCAGSVCWMPLRDTALFERGLKKTAAILAENNYVGMIDLNCIVTSGEVYGLEWTPRFGYEAACNLTRLLPVPFGEFMYRIATGQSVNLAGPRHRFAATIRISVPPYPSSEKARNEKFAHIPIEGIDPEQIESFYLSNVRTGEFGLETIGSDQPIGAPIGTGETIRQAFTECRAAIDRLMIPDLQWRNDVEKKCEERYERLVAQGWLRAVN
jgi:phosphoribosylamine---glycine ligase